MQLRRGDVLRCARALLDAEGLDGLILAALSAALEAPTGRLDMAQFRDIAEAIVARADTRDLPRPL